MARSLTAILALLLLTGPAHADPIVTPMIVAVLGAEIAGTVIVGTLTIGAVLSAVITTAVGIGLSLLFAPKPKTPTPESGIIVVRQSIPYRATGYGRMPYAGAVMFEEELNGWLMVVNAIAGHKIHAFTGLYLNDDSVTCPTTGGRLSGNVAAGADGRYTGGAVKIDTRLGLPVETHYSQITAFVPTLWTANHRLDGQASLSMMCYPIEAKYFSNYYPNAAPAPRPIIEWRKVYDWRDPSQDINDPETWDWSQNSTLCIVDWLCHNPFGFGEPFARAIEPFIDEWTLAADLCDDLEPVKAGGSEPRYRTDGFTTTETPNSSTLLTLLQCCDGHLVSVGGRYRLKVGHFIEPEVVITDDDIVSVQFQVGQTTENRVNEGFARYTYPDAAYISVDSDPVIDEADQNIRPGGPRRSQLDLNWVHAPGQASRLLRREMKRQQVELRGKLILHWSGKNAAYERWVRVQSNSLPNLNNVVIEIVKSVVSAAKVRVEIDFIGSGADIDDYDAATMETTLPTIATKPLSSGPPQPSGVSIIGVLNTDANNVSTVVLIASFDTPLGADGNPRVDLTYKLRYRLADDGTGNPGPYVEQTFTDAVPSGGRITLQSNIVQPGVTLLVEVATVGLLGTPSPYSTPVTISTDTNNLAPSAPSLFTALGNVGYTDLSAKAPNSTNFYGLQFYRGLPATSFGASSPVGAVQTGARNATITYTDTVSAGAYLYWVVAKTSAGVGSPPTGPISVTVT